MPCLRFHIKVCGRNDDPVTVLRRATNANPHIVNDGAHSDVIARRGIVNTGKNYALATKLGLKSALTKPQQGTRMQAANVKYHETMKSIYDSRVQAAGGRTDKKSVKLIQQTKLKAASHQNKITALQNKINKAPATGPAPANAQG